MPQITPNLWFDTEGKDAAEFYCSIVPNSRINNVTYYGEAGPGETGTVLTVDFELDGERFTAINGGPHYKLTPAVSFMISCQDQDEVDYYWDKLLEGGGQAVQCGWLTDRFGLSWQVIPKQLEELIGDPDPGRSQRAMTAMLGMVKIDIAAMRAAADGD